MLYSVVNNYAGLLITQANQQLNADIRKTIEK